MSLDIEALLAEAELPETSVTLCLKGSLVSRFEALDTQLSHLPATPGSLAGNSEAAGIAAQLEQLRAEMTAHERVFLIRAMPALDFAALRATQPDKTSGQSDKEFAAAYHLWVCQVVAGSCYDPLMTAEQVDRLCAVLSDGQWRRLSNAAWNVNAGDSKIPFSEAGFALTRTSAAKSPQQETPASPEAGSLAGPAAPSPNTSTPTDS